MKILLISGNHSRHLYVHKKILQLGMECAAIVMEREEVNPVLNEESGFLSHDIKNYNLHFKSRFEIEKSKFGNLEYEKIFRDIDYIFCNKHTLNNYVSEEFIKKFNPDICIIFGSGIIRENLINVLPYDTINFHLGLSPFYKGSATLFWPFYNLEPQFSGVTIHKVIKKVDAGGILHQSTPKLNHLDGIHDVAANAVVEASDDLVKIVKSKTDKDWTYREQRTNGRLYLTKDFHPSHLRIIYDLYDNKIVNEYLNNKLKSNRPNLINYFKK
tara:strand:+ start:700 stop:1512 length:813 start_codon:yes stop_codon:yes gene_type:complete